MYRKAALKVARATEEERRNGSWVIDAENVEEYVGKPKFTADRMYIGQLPAASVCLLRFCSTLCFSTIAMWY